MNKQIALKDFFVFGIFFAVCWHAFWILLFNPMIERTFLKWGSGECVFLGQILDDADFKIPSLKRGEGVLRTPEASGDLSKEGYFFKTAVNFDKPLATIKRGEGSKHQALRYEKKTEADAPVKNLREVTFGPSDFGPYVDNVDFSDCRPYFSREDLLGFIDFEVILKADGLVQSIKKMTSCGDPTVDLVVLRKLKNAVFKDCFPLKALIRVHFKLK